MISVIKIILKFRTLKKIIISNIDSYDPLTLLYLANALKLIEIEKIELVQKDLDK